MKICRRTGGLDPESRGKWDLIQSRDPFLLLQRFLECKGIGGVLAKLLERFRSLASGLGYGILPNPDWGAEIIPVEIQYVVA